MENRHKITAWSAFNIGPISGTPLKNVIRAAIEWHAPNFLPPEVSFMIKDAFPPLIDFASHYFPPKGELRGVIVHRHRDGWIRLNYDGGDSRLGEPATLQDAGRIGAIGLLQHVSKVVVYENGLTQWAIRDVFVDTPALAATLIAFEADRPNAIVPTQTDRGVGPLKFFSVMRDGDVLPIVEPAKATWKEPKGVIMATIAAAGGDPFAPEVLK